MTEHSIYVWGGEEWKREGEFESCCRTIQAQLRVFTTSGSEVGYLELKW